MSIYPLLIASLLALSACQSTQPSEDESDAENAPSANSDVISITTEQASSLGLQVGAVQQITVSDEVRATGIVDVPPQYRASVSAPIAGIVKSISVLPGQAVRKGQSLLTLQSLEYVQMQQDYLQAASQTELLAKELERQRTLTSEEVGARKRLQQAEADYRANQAVLNGLGTKLTLLGTPLATLRAGRIQPALTVRAPISGHVSSTAVNLGQDVSPATALIDLINREHMHLELKVYEKDALKIRKGQPILITDKRIDNQPVRGTVFLVGQDLQGEDRTINIHGHITNRQQEARLLPGLYLTASILTGSRRAMTVPEDAVVRRGETGFLFVETARNQYRRVPVRIGAGQNGQLEIQPLQDTRLTRVVLKGAYGLAGELTKGEEE
ncbi:efflux RND transporter periplasmic adaptor subunit [Tellurirhabdus rosea]|uniref:efflux RND transporter periplasmic adaptor subunit n=1 Tax=Tellurirhabdus rosea TaxID=2674997 RepID=UPI0022548CB5|nr:efflux RND transporter periplasmic adaptor subunit [Tellurirhabdus rosea]